MNQQRSGITMVEGTFFDYDDLDSNTYTIYSVAVALSNTCRYAGQIEDFYSVAQHSVMVSLIVPPEQALAGLMHDCAEFVMHDVNKPLKKRTELCAYEHLYRRVERHMFRKFNLPIYLTPEIHHADAVMFATERRDLQHISGVHANSSIELLPGHLIPLPPKQARDLFLARYLELTQNWKPE
jgi:uncharacterized protein